MDGAVIICITTATTDVVPHMLHDQRVQVFLFGWVGLEVIHHEGDTHQKPRCAITTLKGKVL